MIKENILRLTTWMAVFMTLCTPTAFANQENSLKGVIISSEDKMPLAYATVYVAETQQGTITDEQGVFHLHLKDGTYNLTFSVLGYKSQKQAITISSKHNKPLQIALLPLTHEIDEVVVQGKSQTATLQDKGFAIGNVSTKLAVAQSFSTEELLNRSAGVRIRQGGGIGSETEYNINGLTGNSIKVYIDGVPISSFGNDFSIANIPASMIERIEVFKGVVPAHLADDALGGAINVIMKKGGMQTLNTSYSYGSFNTHQADINGLYKNAKTGFFIGSNAHYNRSDNNYKVWGDAVYVTDQATGRVEKIKAERFHDGYQAYGVNLNTGFTGKKWADDLRLNLIFNSIDKDIQNGATMETVYGNRRTTQDSYMANLRYQKRDILPRLDLTTSLAYSFADRMLIDTTNVKYNWSGQPITDIHGNIIHWATTGEGGRATLASNLEHSINNRTSLQYPLDKARKHILSVNGSYRYFQRNIEDPLLSKLEQDLTDARKINKYTLAAAYDTKLFDDKLSISVFYKYFAQTLSLSDPQSIDGVITPQQIDAKMNGSGYGATLSYRLLPALRINVSAEKALRLPGVTEMIGNTAQNIEPNYNIRPEQSVNLNIGANLEDMQWDKHVLQAGFNLFYRNVNDMIQRAEINKGDETYGYENIGKILSKGADIEAKYTFDQCLSLYAATSYTDARFNLRYDENGAEYAWYGDKLRNMPYFTANGGASYTFNNLFKRKHKLQLAYHLNYVHEFFKNWESLGTAGKATIPAQLTHDISATYILPNEKLSFSIDAKNILNEQLFDNFALQKPGRMIFAKINYKIF